jgi:hypothetical protein
LAPGTASSYGAFLETISLGRAHYWTNTLTTWALTTLLSPWRCQVDAEEFLLSSQYLWCWMFCTPPAHSCTLNRTVSVGPNLHITFHQIQVHSDTNWVNKNI